MIISSKMFDWAYLFSEDGQSIVYEWAIPLHAAVILAEMIYSAVTKAKLYTVKDTFTNVYLALMQFGLDLLMKGFAMFVMFWFFTHSPFHWEKTFWYWIAVFLAQDFAYYVLHLADHKSRILWAVHFTHHNSEHFNITTGFRSSVFEPLYRYLFFSPLAFMGFNPWDVMVMYAIVQVYGTWVHTQTIKGLGVLEYVFVSPSHHRVHHASNVPYLDKNMGMMLIIWDRMFGTFAKEDPSVEITYGVRTPLKDDKPGTVIFTEFRKLWQDLKQPHLTFLDRVKYIFYPPGWRHDGTGKTVRDYQREENTQPNLPASGEN